MSAAYAPPSDDDQAPPLSCFVCEDDVPTDGGKVTYAHGRLYFACSDEHAPTPERLARLASSIAAAS